MSTILASFIWGALFYLGIALYKTYHAIPNKELKRRARSHHASSAVLYRVQAFGSSLDVLLWVWVGVSGAVFLSVFDNLLHGFFAVVILAVLLWFGLFWIPNSRVTRIHEIIAVRIAPGFIFILNGLHPILDRVGRFIKRMQHATLHTGIYERDDLIDLLQRQQQQADNRMTAEELNIAIHALQFGQELVRDIVIAKRVVRFVSVDDTVGPVLMGELHDSGHSRFPVYDTKKDNVVGMLYLRDLVGKNSGKVGDILHKEVLYIHESENLHQALSAMLKKRHHLFMVVNSFEEIVGIITLEDVLERIIGTPIVDEFDQYDDLKEVASKAAAKVHVEQKHEKLPDTDQG